MRIALAALSLLSSFLFAADPFLEKVDVFKSGENGYKFYRIPGLVVTAKGTVLAYCEARKGLRGDWDAIDIHLRRSTDGGKTWSAPASLANVDGPKTKNPAALAQKLAKEDGTVTYNNPVAIADANGSVHLLFCLEYMRCFYIRSEDDGVTWSKPVEITSVFDTYKPGYDWQVLATGPAHGIQLKNGRLVVPVWLSTGKGGHAHRPSVVSTIFSDDHGQSWKAGAIAIPNTSEFVNPNETVLAQLADGRVMLNSRSESKRNRRLVTTSADGSSNWSAPTFQEDLHEPICMAALARWTEVPAADKNRLLFANPGFIDPKVAPGKSHPRKDMVVKLSYDEGSTWTVSKQLEEGFSGYPDLAVLPDGTALCFYERGSTDGKNSYNIGNLTLARFNLPWLTEGKDDLKK